MACRCVTTFIRFDSGWDAAVLRALSSTMTERFGYGDWGGKDAPSRECANLRTLTLGG